MLEYDRIDVSKEIDVNKTKESRRCTIRIYYFLEVIFDFVQTYMMVLMI